MKKSSLLYVFRRLLLMAFLAASLQTTMQAAAPKEIGIGERAPLFVLKDQNGSEFSLETMIKKGPVAVVFVRSVDWCVYCQLQTVQLSENLKGTSGNYFSGLS